MTGKSSNCFFSCLVWWVLLVDVALILSTVASLSALECSSFIPWQRPFMSRDRAAAATATAAPLLRGLDHRSQTTIATALNRTKVHPLSSATAIIAESESQALVMPKAGKGKPYRRLMQNAPAGIRLELMHRDHEQSPLRGTGNLTIAERIRRDVARSRARALCLSHRMMQHLGQGDNVSASVLVDEIATVETDTYEARLSATGAEYVMSFMLGTPPQKFVVVVDTGSDLVWVQCLPCQQCFQQVDNVFNSERSSSYRYLTCSNPICNALGSNLASCSPTCQYQYGYGDQSSTSGDFSSETVTLSTTSGTSQAVPNFAFGCGHKNQGTFHSTDGLVGLGQGSFSFSSQLGSLFGDKFSYCLVSRGQALSQTSPLLFGEAAVPMVSSGLQFTPILSSNPGVSTFYYVGLNGLSVNGSPLDISSDVFAKSSAGTGGTIFDSGTTFTQLASVAYDAVIAAFQTAIFYPQVPGSPNVGLDLCFDITGVENVAIPDLTFHFMDADFNLPGSSTFVLVDSEGTMCLAISRSSTSLNIFGNTQQQNFQILYDREDSRIGFTPLTCSSL